MIGTRAFLMQLPLLLLPILILLGTTVVVLRSRRRFAENNVSNGRKHKLAAVAAIAIFLLMAANGAYRLAEQVQYHYTLENLRADSVRRINVGAVQLDKADDVAAIIGALHNEQWYEPTAGDGGWATNVEMRIQFKSGDELHYPIARHKRNGGIVIAFVSQDRNSRFVGHYGYAIAEHLSPVLDQLKVPLPTK